MARRRWEFHLDDGRHVVELEHGYFLGMRKLRVDGVMSVERGKPFTDHSGDYPFRVGSADAVLRIRTNGFTYFYDVLVDGRSVDPGARPPRPAFSGPKAAAILGAGILLLWLPIGIWVVDGLVKEYRLSTDRVDAIGRVIERTKGSGRYGPSYSLRYEFFADSGVFTGSGPVSERTYIRTAVGDRFYVTFVRSDPTINRFTGADDLPGLLAGSLLTLFVVTVGGRILVGALRTFDLHRALRERGVPREAHVVRAKEDFQRGLGRIVTLEYGFADDEGKMRRGRTPPLFPAEADEHPVGSKLRILYDPRSPGRNGWIEEIS